MAKDDDSKKEGKQDETSTASETSHQDDEIDVFEMTDDEATAQHRIEQLRAKLKECQKEKQAYLDGWQREKADALNVKQRQNEELVRERTRSTAEHVKKLLPLCDSFDMARADASWEQADASWKRGIEQIYNQLQTILAAYAITTVGIEGEPFDPHVHEAVSNTPVEDASEHNTVVSVFQKGYKMDDELLRPARVVVGEAVEQNDKQT